MHLFLGIVGAIVTLLILMKRLQDNGIDIGWLNPFNWLRQYEFRKLYKLSPAYGLQAPMEVAALFMVAMAKVDGDMSKEQRSRILQLFQSEFKLSEPDAIDLLSSSVHVFGRGEEVWTKPQLVVARSLDAFTPEQVSSTIYMLKEISTAEGYPSLRQESLIDRFIDLFPQTTSS